MLKKSKVVALLVVCVMMFAVVEPACARTWGEWFTETAVGGVAGAVLGGAVVVATGGALLPIVAGGTALGAIVGSVPEEKRIDLVSGTAAGGILGWIMSAAFNK